MSPRNAASVLVVGAGVGGLAAACFLKQSGRKVTVIERSTSGPPSAPGLLLHSNALRVLASLGEAEPIEREGTLLRGAILLGEGGHRLSEVSFEDEIRRGERTVGASHDRLLSRLAARLGEAALRPGLTVSNMNVGDERADVFFSDGRHERFDLVIGADGARSRIRELLLGPIEARRGGCVSWRALVPHPAGLPLDRTGEALGSGLRASWVPVGQGQSYLSLASVVGADVAPLRALDAQGIRQRFAPLGGPIDALLEHLSAPIFGEVTDLWADRWHQGCVVLLGDAAHAMTPGLAQGAAMALEDAKALQFCLDQSATTGEGLAAYGAMRQGRVRAIFDASFDANRVHLWTNRAAISFRNLLYRMLPAESSRARLRALIDGGNQLRECLSHRPDLPPLSAESMPLVRFLIKIGQCDGRFDDQERAFIQQSLQQQGEQISQERLEEMSRQLHRVSLAEVLEPMQISDHDHRLRLLELGYLAAMANGQLAARERRALEEARELLAVSEQEVAAIRQRVLG